MQRWQPRGHNRKMRKSICFVIRYVQELKDFKFYRKLEPIYNRSFLDMIRKVEYAENISTKRN